MEHPIYHLYSTNDTKYEIVKNTSERRSLPTNFRMHNIHHIVRQWQPNGPYSIQCPLYHATHEFQLSGYIHAHAPHIFTLQPHNTTTQRQWRIDHIPNIIDNQQPFTQLIDKMEYNIAYCPNTLIPLPNTQYCNESMYHIQEIYTNPFNELHTHISSSHHATTIRHSMIFDQYRANSNLITITPNQHILGIITTIQHELHALISDTINNVQSIARSYSQHHKMAYIRHLKAIHHPNSPLLQHIIACYQQYLTQYTIPSPCIPKELSS